MVCYHRFARDAGKIKSRSFIYDLSCELSAKWALLLNHLKNRGSSETTGSGVVHGQLMGVAKPSFQNIFNGHGKFFTCPGILVCYMAEPCISDSRPE
jgi:hypothetical protein